MRAVVDPRVQRLVKLLNQLEEVEKILRRWPKSKLEGRSGSGPGSSVLLNVSAWDLAGEVHGVLVSWAGLVSEERGVAPPDPAWSSWAMTPGGTWYATGGDTALVVRWLLRHSGWLVERSWYVEEMWPELRRLQGRGLRMMGLYRPPGRSVQAAIELAAEGRSIDEVREVARARRAD